MCKGSPQCAAGGAVGLHRALLAPPSTQSPPVGQHSTGRRVREAVRIRGTKVRCVLFIRVDPGARGRGFSLAVIDPQATNASVRDHYQNMLGLVVGGTVDMQANPFDRSCRSVSGFSQFLSRFFPDHKIIDNLPCGLEGSSYKSLGVFAKLL